MKADAHYEYRCEDHSLLLRLLEPALFKPLVRVLPRGITPNQITIAGQLAALVGFVLVAAGRPLGGAGLVLLAAAIWFYTAADCMDGLFARHTKQTSRLGELLDHWLDAVSVPLVVLSFGLALPAAPALVFAGAVAISFLHYATFLHGFRLGWVHLGKLGMLEGASIGAAACAVVAVWGPAPLARPVVAGWSAASLLLLVFVVGSCTALWAMRGLWRHRADFAPLTLLFAALVLWFAFGRLPVLPAAVMVIAVGSYLEGNVIRARLLRGPLVLWDAVLFGLVLAAAGASLALDLTVAAQSLAAGGIAAYAFVRGGIAFFQTMAVLRLPVSPSSP
jgi:phosphatidylglycerophosphate synthase